MRRTDVVDTNGDPRAVSLVCNAVDFLDVVRVGEDLVTSDDVLRLD
jgi:acyl dehydratase